MPTDSIKSAIQSGHGTAIVYAGAIGLLLSDIIPTPADAVVFYYQRKNRVAYENKTITAKQYWFNDLALYYGANPIWWLIVLGAVYATKGDYTAKLKVGVGIIAAGAIFAVVANNIKEDTEQQKTIEIVNPNN
jgi:hypothetical protein